MKSKFTFWVTILFLTPKSYSQCTISSSNIYSFVYDGRTYEVVKEQKSWLDAVSCAVNRGGYLVEINSLDEQNAISSQIPSAGINFSQTIVPESGSPGLWLGGNDFNLEGDWVWNGNNDGVSQLFYSRRTGGSILYSNFGCRPSTTSCEPDNFMGNQHALVIQTSTWHIGVANQWNDVSASNLLYFIIEYDFLSSNTFENTKEVSIYPNPTDSLFYLELSQNSSVKLLEIYDIAGKLVKKFNTLNDDKSADVSDLEEGLYSIRIYDNENDISIHKLIKN